MWTHCCYTFCLFRYLFIVFFLLFYLNLFLLLVFFFFFLFLWKEFQSLQIVRELKFEFVLILIFNSFTYLSFRFVSFLCLIFLFCYFFCYFIIRFIRFYLFIYLLASVDWLTAINFSLLSPKKKKKKIEKKNKSHSHNEN